MTLRSDSRLGIEGLIDQLSLAVVEATSTSSGGLLVD